MTAGQRARPVGVGLIGAGAAGHQHLDALADCPAAVPVAVYDNNPEALAALLGKCAGDPRLHSVLGMTDAGQLLDDERIELIAIATPPGSHVSLALRALAAGRSVLLEKPPVLSLADLDSIVSAAEAHGLTAGVMLQHRFRLPPQASARPWDADTIASVEVVRYRPQQHYAKADWRVEPRDSGGGLVAHLGVHYLDLACRLLGAPVAVAAAVDVLPGTGIDQRVALSAEFGSGARLSFIGTTAVDLRHERLAVLDSGRSLVLDPRSTVYLADASITEAAPSTASLRTKVYADVADAVRNRRAPAVADLASAWGVVRLIEEVNAATPVRSAR